MYTLNANPHLMLQLAATTRADQIDRADRSRAHAPARRVRSAGTRRGFWGGLRRRTARAVPGSARTV